MKITIVTVCFNCEDTIEDTVNSVLDQTYNHIEYIIIDGKSFDNTCSIIQKLIIGKSNVKFFSESDEGIYDAMNKAIDFASGDFLLYVNSGDTLKNEFVVENAAIHIKNRNTIYCFAFDSKIVINNKEAFRCYLPIISDYSLPSCHNAMFFPTNNKVKYDLKYKICADLNYYLYYTMKLKTNVKLVFESILTYPMGGFSEIHVLKSVVERYNILKKYYPYIKVLVFFIKQYMKTLLFTSAQKIFPENLIWKWRKKTGYKFVQSQMHKVENDQDMN